VDLRCGVLDLIENKHARSNDTLSVSDLILPERSRSNG
jgi:hypothetical protein